MNNTTSNLNESEESFVKHTTGGEMPDTSRISSIRRRTQGSAPVLSEGFNLKSVLVPLTAVGVGVSAYLLFKRMQSNRSTVSYTDENEL